MKLKSHQGKFMNLAEVVRDLNKGDDLMVDQSYSERQLFEKAYERIMSEFQIVLDASLEDTQKKLDKALKRNLAGPNSANIAQAIPKTPTAELPVDEPISDNRRIYRGIKKTPLTQIAMRSVFNKD